MLTPSDEPEGLNIANGSLFFSFNPFSDPNELPHLLDFYISVFLRLIYSKCVYF